MLRKLANGIVILVIIVTVAVITFAIASPKSVSQNGLATTIKTNSLQPAASLTTMPPTLTAAATVVPTVAGTPQIGSEIPLPFSGKGIGLSSFMRTPDLPLISEQDAMKAIHNLGINFAYGGQFNGKTVTVWAAFGLGTLGEPGKNGQGWVGEQHFPVRTCESSGKCTETGQFLDRIDHRPMWVIDYGNLDIPVGAPPPWNPNPPPLTNSVYFVDAQMKSVLITESYN